MADLFTNTENEREPAKPPKPITVSQLSKKINETLEGRIGRIDVVGQINSPKFMNHWYFTLADEDAKIDCAMWASSVSTIKNGEFEGGKPKQGDMVVIRGMLGHFAKYGKTQLYVERMKSAGDEKGSLQKAFDELVLELREKGWFDEAHKKQLPQYPRKIAVITSKTSAAVRDVIETARQRWSVTELLVVNVPVQGNAAVPSIMHAIESVDKAAETLGIDAIIVTRGGGSLEELWSFNDRGVVEAAFRCNTPIVSAIGHESDTSIIELVSDLRASTPTQAAMALVPDRDELSQMVEHFNLRLSSVAKLQVERGQSRVRHQVAGVCAIANGQLHKKASRISALSEALTARRPGALVQKRKGRVSTLSTALKTYSHQTIERARAGIDAMAGKLDAIDPSVVLERGFSLTEDASGNLIRRAQDVKEGQKIRTVLAHGTIESEVECTS
ncbi:MAG: exodeoxyribonuclease VII large subunit [Planctomycetes bacterium]|nr:exodeoxyribonuclease VII large subunit [Planctomycetota bacterium]